MALGIDIVYIPRFYGKEKLAKRILSTEEYAIYEHGIFSLHPFYGENNSRRPPLNHLFIIIVSSASSI